MIDTSTNNFSVDDNDDDSVNSIVLLTDHIEVIDVSSLEKFIALLNVDEKKLNIYFEVMKSAFASQ